MFWWAILSLYPSEALGNERNEYLLMQFPVGLLGGLFDSLAFFLTIYLTKDALKSHFLRSYITHLGISIIIAVIATWWILFVFLVSGWLVALILHDPQSLEEKSQIYQERLEAAFNNSTERHNLKNIYFGLIMDASSIFPLLMNIFTSIYAGFKYCMLRMRGI